MPVVPRVILSTLLSVLCLGMNTPASAAARPGTAIAIGGALKLDNAPVWQRIVDEAGGAGSRFAVLATASDNPQRAGERIVAALTRAGANAELIPVAPKLAGADWQRLRDDAPLAARVAAMQGVFFSGGAQEKIVDTLRPGGRETALLQAIRQVLAQGGVVAGTSAGAAIMSEWMFRDAQDSLSVLKGQLREGREIDRGLGFAGPALFVDQHFLKRGRIGRLLPAMVAKGYRWGLGVEENSAALIRGDQIEVIGARGALLVDLHGAQHELKGGLLRLGGAALSFLDRGDRFDLGKGELRPAADKLGGRIDPNAAGFKPYFQRAGFFADLLGDNAIVQAMSHLVDSPERELRGLAFDGRALIAGAADALADGEPDLGFEFRLYKGADTLAWFTGAWGGEDYSLSRVYLDLRPVRMQRPLYTPWTTPARAATPGATGRSLADQPSERL